MQSKPFAWLFLQARPGSTFVCTGAPPSVRVSWTGRVVSPALPTAIRTACELVLLPRDWCAQAVTVRASVSCHAVASEKELTIGVVLVHVMSPLIVLHSSRKAVVPDAKPSEERRPRTR